MLCGEVVCWVGVVECRLYLLFVRAVGQTDSFVSGWLADWLAGRAQNGQSRSQRFKHLSNTHINSKMTTHLINNKMPYLFLYLHNSFRLSMSYTFSCDKICDQSPRLEQILGISVKVDPDIAQPRSACALTPQRAACLLLSPSLLPGTESRTANLIVLRYPL